MVSMDHHLGTPYGVIMGSLWGPQMGPYLGSQDPIMVYPIMPSGEACSSGIPGSLIWYPWITIWGTPYDPIWGHNGVIMGTPYDHHYGVPVMVMMVMTSQSSMYWDAVVS